MKSRSAYYNLYMADSFSNGLRPFHNVFFVHPSSETQQISIKLHRQFPYKINMCIIIIIWFQFNDFQVTSCPFMKFVHVTPGRYSVTRSNFFSERCWGCSSFLVIALVSSVGYPFLALWSIYCSGRAIVINQCPVSVHEQLLKKSSLKPANRLIFNETSQNWSLGDALSENFKDLNSMKNSGCHGNQKKKKKL